LFGVKLLIVEDNPLIAAAIEKAGERLNLTADFATMVGTRSRNCRTSSTARS